MKIARNSEKRVLSSQMNIFHDKLSYTVKSRQPLAISLLKFHYYIVTYVTPSVSYKPKLLLTERTQHNGIFYIIRYEIFQYGHSIWRTKYIQVEITQVIKS